MAKKRMFSHDVVETDRFLNLPPSAQLLYFHLGMHGDDDGFVAAPKTVMRSCKCRTRDLTTLEENGFIQQFPSGVCAVTGWKTNNTLKNDRYRPTIYLSEKYRMEHSGDSMPTPIEHLRTENPRELPEIFRSFPEHLSDTKG